MSTSHYTIIPLIVLLLVATSSLSASPRFKATEFRIQPINRTPLVRSEAVTSGVTDKVTRLSMLRSSFQPSWNSEKEVETTALMLSSQSYNHSSMHGGSNAMLAVAGMVAVMAVVMLVVMRS